MAMSRPVVSGGTPGKTGAIPPLEDRERWTVESDIWRNDHGSYHHTRKSVMRVLAMYTDEQVVGNSGGVGLPVTCRPTARFTPPGVIDAVLARCPG